MKYLILLIPFLVFAKNSEFKKEIDFFERYKGSKINSKIEISFKLLDSKTQGECYPISKRIYINTLYYKYMSDIEKKALIAHELGHCDLDLRHASTATRYPDGCPTSVMVPNDFPLYCLNTHIYSYMKELFIRTDKLSREEKTYYEYN